MNLIGVIQFFTSNARSFLIVGLLVAGSVVALNVYNGVREAAMNEVRIEQYQENERVYRSTIESQERAIEAQQKASEILVEELDNREDALREVSERETKLKESTIGPGMDEPASDYMRELIRTMGENP